LVHWSKEQAPVIKVFYADFRKAHHELGWEPKIDLEEGIAPLFNWVKENKELFIQVEEIISSIQFVR